MKKSKRVLVILISLLIVGGVISYNLLSGIAKNKEVTGATTNINDTGIPTEIISVNTSNLIKEIKYIGTIKPKKSAEVSPKIMSQVSSVLIKEGDMVNKGDVIARLDDSQITALIASTMSKMDTLKVSYAYLNSEVNNFNQSNSSIKKLATMESNYKYLEGEAEKYRTLYEQKAVSKNAYDKVNHEKDIVKLQLDELKASSSDIYNKLVHEKDMTGMQLKELESKLQELNVNLEDTLIVAPISGRIRALNYSAGDMASAGKPFVIIDDTENFIAIISLTEQDLKKIKVGTKAVLNITGLNEEVNTSLSRVLPSINDKTRIGEVEIDIPQSGKNENIASGASTEVSFILDEVEEGLTIPKTAIKELNNKSLVYVINSDNTALEIEIKKGIEVDGQAQVIEGLKIGDKIAANNLNKLYNGVQVYMVKGDEE